MPNLPNWKQTLVRLLSGYFFAAIAYYMIPALIVLNLTARNTEPVLIGLLAACQPVGLLLALVLVEPLVARYDAYATFMGAFWLALGVSLSFILSDALLLWAVAVILIGVASGIYYVIAESWVALLCPPEQRGQIVSIFETIIGATSLLAPLILLLTGTSGWLPFVVAAILTGIGLLIFLPMQPPSGLHPTTDSPALARPQRLAHTLRQIGAMVLAAALLGGLYEAGIPAVLPPFSVQVGFSLALATLLVAVIGMGSLLQIPIGYLADRMAWQRLMLAATVLLVVASLLLPLALRLPAVLWLLGFVWGMLGGGLYTLAVIRVGATLRGIQLVQGTTAIFFAYIIGNIIGPVLGGVGLSFAPTYGLSIVFGGVGLAGLGVMVIGHTRHMRHKRGLPIAIPKPPEG